MRAHDPHDPTHAHGPARWFGVYPAKVTSVKDEDKQGRVQVELLFSPELNGEAFRVWARLATLMAGGKRGSFFIPEVDDEVLIAFHGGDPRSAYVLGSVWNGKDAPPEKMDGDGKNNLRVLQTRSGHRLEFDDTQGSPKITLTTPNGCKLILDDGSGGSIALRHPGGAALEMDAQGGVKITAPQQLTIDAPMVQVEAQMSNFNGVTQHQTNIAQSVVGSTYTPGAGNIW